MTKRHERNIESARRQLENIRNTWEFASTGYPERIRERVCDLYEQGLRFGISEAVLAEMLEIPRGTVATFRRTQGRQVKRAS